MRVAEGRPAAVARELIAARAEQRGARGAGFEIEDGVGSEVVLLVGDVREKRFAGGAGGDGGSGVVIIYYTTGTLRATGGKVSVLGTQTLHTFTTTGGFFTPVAGVPVTPPTVTTTNGWFLYRIDLKPTIQERG